MDLGYNLKYCFCNENLVKIRVPHIGFGGKALRRGGILVGRRCSIFL